MNQALTLLGGWHTQVDIRFDVGVIKQKLDQVAPHLVFGHMLLWSPGGPGKTQWLLEQCAELRKTGTKVVIHDGDVKPETRWPHDISASVDLALCNHGHARAEWNIPTLHWPYFAFVQGAIAKPVPLFACDLAFAGRRGGGIYSERERMLTELEQRKDLVFKVFPNKSVAHTLFRTPEVAASATAMLGHGRPNSNGWLDVRVFLIPGAGGVLLHDDVAGYLEPWRHYIPYETGDVDSIMRGVEHAREHGDRIRREAFAYVQSHHTSVVRMRQVLKVLGLEA